MMQATTVAICIATHQRPATLRRLLQSLQELIFVKVNEPEITIVLVDNDPAASARTVIPEFLSRRYRIRYRLESRPGISYARNTAIEHARFADFLAFLDDDEECSPEWLDEMLTVQAAYHAQIVAGPVLPHFESLPPQWLLDGRFYQRRRHATGTPLTSVGAGNVLIGSRVLHAMAPNWFDPRYSLTGGEDTHFFRRCASLGFPVIWADDAIAYESVPASRISSRYLISRARNGANQWTRVEFDLHPTVTGLGSRLAVGMLRVLQGSAVAVVAPALAPRHQLRGQLLLAEGIGNLNAFLGRNYNLYGPRS